MKKISILIILSALLITISASKILADYLQDAEGTFSLYQNLAQGRFYIYGGWYSLDSVSFPMAAIPMSYSDASSDLYLGHEYFSEFEYTPDINIDILKRMHSADTYSVPSEGPAVFMVRYADIYGNPPSDGYPKLDLLFPDNSSQTYTMDVSSFDPSVYVKSLDLPLGAYQYRYYATNAEYQNGGFYELTGNWYVTTRPYNFVKYAPLYPSEVLPDNVVFSWSVSTDLPGDVLSYELYIGKDSNKANLEKYQTDPSPNSFSFTIPSLDHKKQYYWYMVVKNKYGAELVSDLYPFYTGGMVGKFYNAPNPFNPARGGKTTFVFGMPEDGTAKIALYSEYGDRVWESDTVNAQGNTSSEISYDGRDGAGRMLYNGSYLAILTKKYGGQTKIEKCRILIIK